MTMKTKYSNLTIYWEHTQWNREDKCWDIDILLNFETKEDYLKWRRKWREAYNDLSCEIRQWKKKRVKYIWSNRTKIGDNPIYDYEAAEKASDLKRIAKLFLKTRAYSKVAAETSYLRIRQAA